jgi:hypothetical protein
MIRSWQHLSIHIRSLQVLASNPPIDQLCSRVDSTCDLPSHSTLQQLMHGETIALNLHKTAAKQHRCNALQARAMSHMVEIAYATAVMAQKQGPRSVDGRAQRKDGQQLPAAFGVFSIEAIQVMKRKTHGSKQPSRVLVV